jgi:hypothetical protein
VWIDEQARWPGGQHDYRSPEEEQDKEFSFHNVLRIIDGFPSHHSCDRRVND